MKRISIITGILILTLGVFAQKKKAEVKHLNAEEFRKAVFDYKKYKAWSYKGKKPLLIDFYANWCGPCRKIAPVLIELQEEYGSDIQIYKVNVDKEKELAAVFGVRSIPVLLFVPVGEKPQMAKGALPKEMFVNAFDRILKLKPKKIIE